MCLSVDTVLCCYEIAEWQRARHAGRKNKAIFKISATLFSPDCTTIVVVVFANVTWWKTAANSSCENWNCDSSQQNVWLHTQTFQQPFSWWFSVRWLLSFLWTASNDYSYLYVGLDCVWILLQAATMPNFLVNSFTLNVYKCRVVYN